MSERGKAMVAALIENEGLRRWNELWKRYNHIYYAYAARCGISQSTLDVLYAMAVLGEGCTQRQICGETGIPKTTVNSSVKKLVEQGCLSCSPRAGRDVCLHLTEQGRALFERVVFPLVQQEARAFAAFDPGSSRRALGFAEAYTDELERLLGLPGNDASGPLAVDGYGQR